MAAKAAWKPETSSARRLGDKVGSCVSSVVMELPPGGHWLPANFFLLYLALPENGSP